MALGSGLWALRFGGDLRFGICGAFGICVDSNPSGTAPLSRRREDYRVCHGLRLKKLSLGSTAPTTASRVGSPVAPALLEVVVAPLGWQAVSTPSIGAHYTPSARRKRRYPAIEDVRLRWMRPGKMLRNDKASPSQSPRSRPQSAEPQSAQPSAPELPVVARSVRLPKSRWPFRFGRCSGVVVLSVLRVPSWASFAFWFLMVNASRARRFSAPIWGEWITFPGCRRPNGMDMS